MKSTDRPMDGDIASHLELNASEPATRANENASASAEAPRQTIEQILVQGEEPTDEFLEEWSALQNAPELTDEEMERQALEAPGEDGDPNTPE